MPPRPRKNPEEAARTAEFKNLRVENSMNQWAAYPKITDIYRNPTEIQRRQHRIKAHKYKIKHLESQRKAHLDVQKRVMQKVAKHGRGDPASLKATANRLQSQETNLMKEWERIHGRGFEINWSKPRDPLEKRIAAVHRKFRQAEDKLLAARYKPGNRQHDAMVKRLAKINQAIAKEKAALATNTTKLNQTRRRRAR